MCIAILNTTGLISLKTFKTCWTANPDGAGLCYYDGQRIRTLKEMKSVKEFHRAYSDIRLKHPGIDIAIHFRIATHGRINITNCHPFKVSDDTAFIHNGVINGLPASTEFSDTYMFNETILKQLPADFILNTAINTLLGEFIGYSKLVIISGNNSVIINEELGMWDGQNWYSNSSYKAPKFPKSKAINKTEFKYFSGSFEDDYAPIWDDNRKAYVNDVPGAMNSCECCRESAVSMYRDEYQIYMCDRCHDYYHNDMGY